MVEQSGAIASGVSIHPSAVVEKGAQLGVGVQVGPFCYIGSQVQIGDRTILKSHVVVDGITTIGEDNQVYPFASIGDANQDLKYLGEPTRVEVGDRNRIRESVTIHRGTVQGGGLTRIGNDNLLMVNTHIAHDCIVGDRCILANNATLGGHVILDDYVIVGGMTAIHQFCVIGAHSMIGGCSGVAQDVPPFVIAQGNHARPFGLNNEGLKRRGFSPELRRVIRQAYQILYGSAKESAQEEGKVKKAASFEEAKQEIQRLVCNYPELQPFITFFDRSTRGIIR